MGQIISRAEGWQTWVDNQAIIQILSSFGIEVRGKSSSRGAMWDPRECENNWPGFFALDPRFLHFHLIGLFPGITNSEF